MKCQICNNNTNEIIANELRDGTKMDVYFCRKCEVAFLENAGMNQEELKKFYETEYRKIGTPKVGEKTSPSEIFDIYSKFQTNRIPLIKPHLKKNYKLLEIGCSAGMFLYNIKPYVGQIMGLDFDKSSGEFAAKKCKCPIYSDGIDKINIPPNSLDAVCAFQTLEHVTDPENFMRTIGQYLKPKGLVAIEVPNLYDCLPHVYDLPNHRKFFFHKHHIWYFTEKSLLKLMKKSGFVGKIFHTQDYNILNHMHWIEHDAPAPDCIKGLSKPKFYIRDGVNSKIKNDLNEFIEKIDLAYKKKLSELKITSNIMFIGRNKK